MKKFKLLPQILVPVIISMVVALFCLAFFPLLGFIKTIDESSLDQIVKISNAVDVDFNGMLETITYQANSIAGDNEILKILAQRDEKLIIDYMNNYQTPDKADYYLFVSPEGIVLGNTFDILLNGQSIADSQVFKAALKNQSITDISKLLSFPFTMYTGAPLHRDGLDTNEISGVVICGYRLGSEKYVDEYKSLYDVETTIFNYDTRVSTTILNEKGERALGTIASDTVIKEVLQKGNVYVSDVDLFGKPYVGHYSPIKNSIGEIKGIFFTGLSDENTQITIRNTIIISFVIAILALVIVFSLLYYVVKRIIRRLDKVTLSAQAIAVGDLSVDVKRTRMDEIGDLGEAFELMQKNIREQVAEVQKLEVGDLTVDISVSGDKDAMGIALKNMAGNLNSMFGDVSHATAQVASISRQIANGSELLAQGSSEQSVAVEELSSTLTELTHMTDENSKKASKAAELTNSIKSSAEKGTDDMNHMMSAVHEINEASQNISKVMKVIDDIAFQTNILALNAAVEAARAGNAGKGFAVVADEVRSLAAKSAEAAKDTSVLISNSMEKTKIGTQIAEATYASLTAIVSGINESTEIVLDIAKSSVSQSKAIGNISGSIEQVSQVIHQNSSTAEESAAASEEMSSQAMMLEKLVNQFRLK